MVSWCLWLGFRASPSAADDDKGAAIAVGHLGTVCDRGLPGPDSAHPRTLLGTALDSRWELPGLIPRVQVYAL